MPTLWEALPATGHAAKFVAIRHRQSRQLVAIVEGPDAEANARLIVNAPEMDKALKTITGWSRCQCHDTHGDNPNCAVFVAENATQTKADKTPEPFTKRLEKNAK